MGGVKCVEIDVHDGPEGTPIVTHGIQGKSLCSAISFEDTIRAIAKFSKENPNHYPIILSIENQASGNSIYQIYDIFVNHFADKIFNFKGMFHAEKPSSEPLKCQTLNKLRGRILIKTDCDIM